MAREIGTIDGLDALPKKDDVAENETDAKEPDNESFRQLSDGCEREKQRKEKKSPFAEKAVKTQEQNDQAKANKTSVEFIQENLSKTNDRKNDH